MTQAGCRQEWHGERGSVLVGVLVLGSLAVLVVTGLAVLAATEERLAATTLRREQVLGAARVAWARTLGELSATPDFTSVLAGQLAAFDTGVRQTTVVVPVVRTLRLADEEIRLQRELEGQVGVRPDTPRWRLYGASELRRLAAGAFELPDVHLAVWVADDEAEDDGNPLVDHNSVMLVHVEAYGRTGGRATIEGAVRRDAAAGQRLAVIWLDPR